MEPAKLKNPGISKIFGETVREIEKNPAIFLPFLIFAISEFLCLLLLYLAPRMPFSLFFGPLIKTFWGEGFLHYPTNFVLLPKLASDMRMLLSVFLGSLLTGIAVSMVYKKPFKEPFKKYVLLFLVVCMVTGVYLLLIKLWTFGLVKYFGAGHLKLLFVNSALWMGPVTLIASVISGILVQGLFIYAIPSIILGEEKFFKILGKSFGFFKRNFIYTFCLVGLPMLIYIPIIILNYNTAFLVYRLFPELVFWIALLGIIFSSLIIDPLVTVSTAVFYLHKNKKL